MNRQQRRAAARNNNAIPFVRRVRLGSLTDGPIRHPSSATWQPHLKRLKSVFGGFYDKSIDEWEDGFRRDAHPEVEIALWLRGADAFEQAASRRDYSKAVKTDIFGLLLGVMCGQTVADILDCTKALSHAEAGDILRSWGRNLELVPGRAGGAS